MEKKHNPTLLSEHVFPLMLASLGVTTVNNPNNHPKKKKKNNQSEKKSTDHKLQLRLLNKLHLSLLSPNPNPNSHSTLPAPILSLLPALLTSKCAEVVCKCAKFVGSASLYSLEMNQQIANDEETVKSLISGLACFRTRKTLPPICNAILDLTTTSSGLHRLLDCSALNCIM